MAAVIFRSLADNRLPGFYNSLDTGGKPQTEPRGRQKFQDFFK
jgi:hypothetical protein